MHSPHIAANDATTPLCLPLSTDEMAAEAARLAELTL